MPNKYAALMEKFQLSTSKPEPVSDAQLASIEAQLGFALPEDYKEFLQDYGDVLFDDVSVPYVDGYNEACEVGIFKFYGATPNKGSISERYHDILTNPEPIETYFYPGVRWIRPAEKNADYVVKVDEQGIEYMTWPPELLPIGCDSGGNEICLALFGLRPGAILFWRDAPIDDDNLYLLADSFDEFMNLIQKLEF